MKTSPSWKTGGYFDTPKVVPENSCFVPGDNHSNSADRRVFGSVANEEIIKSLIPHFSRFFLSENVEQKC